MKQIDVVGAVILNDEGEVLCARRSPRMSQPGLWEFPGGKVEPGEQPEESLRREIAEELGCEIAVGELVADAVHPYPDVQVRLMTFLARLRAGEPVAREHDALVWLDRGRLGELRWAPADLPTVAALTSPQPDGRR